MSWPTFTRHMVVRHYCFHFSMRSTPQPVTLKLGASIMRIGESGLQRCWGGGRGDTGSSQVGRGRVSKNSIIYFASKVCWNVVCFRFWSRKKPLRNFCLADPKICLKSEFFSDEMENLCDRIDNPQTSNQNDAVVLNYQNTEGSLPINLSLALRMS